MHLGFCGHYFSSEIGLPLYLGMSVSLSPCYILVDFVFVFVKCQMTLYLYSVFLALTQTCFLVLSLACQASVIESVSLILT